MKKPATTTKTAIVLLIVYKPGSTYFNVHAPQGLDISTISKGIWLDAEEPELVDGRVVWLTTRVATRRISRKFLCYEATDYCIEWQQYIMAGVPDAKIKSLGRGKNVVFG